MSQEQLLICLLEKVLFWKSTEDNINTLWYFLHKLASSSSHGSLIRFFKQVTVIPFIYILKYKVHVLGKNLFSAFSNEHAYIWWAYGKSHCTFTHSFLQLLIKKMSSHDDMAFCSNTKIGTHNTSYICLSLAYCF